MPSPSNLSSISHRGRGRLSEICLSNERRGGARGEQVDEEVVREHAGLLREHAGRGPAGVCSEYPKARNKHGHLRRRERQQVSLDDVLISKMFFISIEVSH